jgi:hypothetical protein
VECSVADLQAFGGDNEATKRMESHPLWALLLRHIAPLLGLVIQISPHY